MLEEDEELGMLDEDELDMPDELDELDIIGEGEGIVRSLGYSFPTTRVGAVQGEHILAEHLASCQ